MEPASVIIILVGAAVLAVLLSACCRGLKRAYEMQLANEERIRRRQAYYITQASRNIHTLNDDRAVRVATIARDNDSVTYEIYEIYVPPRTRSHHAQPQNPRSSSDGHEQRNESLYNPHMPPRRARRPRTRHPPEATPPPTYLQVLSSSSPAPKPLHEDEESPPSYAEYLKCQSSLQGNSLVDEPSPPEDANNKLRY